MNFTLSDIARLATALPDFLAVQREMLAKLDTVISLLTRLVERETAHDR